MAIKLLSLPGLDFGRLGLGKLGLGKLGLGKLGLEKLGLGIAGLLVLQTAPAALAVEFHYGQFDSLTPFSVHGDTHAGGPPSLTDAKTLRLTQSGQEWQRTALWLNQALDFSTGFETQFQFQITNPRPADNLRDGVAVLDASGQTGGDGFAFVLRNANSQALGIGGGALGYGGIAHSLALEFDTWDNSDDFRQWGDANRDGFGSGSMLESSNHLSLQANLELETDGYANSEFPRYSIGYNNAIPDLSSGKIHTARIRYEAGMLQVFLNEMLTLRVEKIDLATIINNSQAMFGFTAATGGSWQTQEILNWSYRSLESSSKSAPLQSVPEPAMVIGLAGVVALGWRRRTV